MSDGTRGPQCRSATSLIADSHRDSVTVPPKWISVAISSSSFGSHSYDTIASDYCRPGSFEWQARARHESDGPGRCSQPGRWAPEGRPEGREHRAAAAAGAARRRPVRWHRHSLAASVASLSRMPVSSREPRRPGVRVHWATGARARAGRPGPGTVVRS